LKSFTALVCAIVDNGVSKELPGRGGQSVT